LEFVRLENEIQALNPASKLNRTNVEKLKNREIQDMIDISALHNGIYLVRIYANGMPVIRKIIVRK